MIVVEQSGRRVRRRRSGRRACYQHAVHAGRLPVHNVCRAQYRAPRQGTPRRMPPKATPLPAAPLATKQSAPFPGEQCRPRTAAAPRSVIQNASIYRRLPTRIIDCDPAMFAFLIQHPEVVIDVWQVMGISRITLDKLPDGTYRGTDGAGTTGNVRYLHANFTPDAKALAVIYANGAYDGKPFVTTLKAQSVSGAPLQRRPGNQRPPIHYRPCRLVRPSPTNGPRARRQDRAAVAQQNGRPEFHRNADLHQQLLADRGKESARHAAPFRRGWRRSTSRRASSWLQLCFRAADRYAQREKTGKTGAALLANRADIAVHRVH